MGEVKTGGPGGVLKRGTGVAAIIPFPGEGADISSCWNSGGNLDGPVEIKGGGIVSEHGAAVSGCRTGRVAENPWEN